MLSMYKIGVAKSWTRLINKTTTITVKCINLFLNAFGVILQFSSVTKSCLTLCDPMNCSMPGLPERHKYSQY